MCLRIKANLRKPRRETMGDKRRRFWIGFAWAMRESCAAGLQEKGCRPCPRVISQGSGRNGLD